MNIQIVFTNESTFASAHFRNIFPADRIKVEGGFLWLYRKEADVERSVAMFNLSEIRYWCEVEREPTINEVRASFGLKPIENNIKGADK